MNALFGKKDVELLKKHLQAIIEVEFFTIPFYLTAVYSFTTKALNYSPDGGKTTPLYTLQQGALSVAVQEMYHLQLACNLANAFDVAPVIPKLTLAAGKEIKIPHLVDADGKPLTAKLGDLPAAIRAMVEIETPDEHPRFPAPNKEVKYRSIADLYHATLQLLGGYLHAFSMVAMSADPHFNPKNQIAYATFETTYNYNKVVLKPDVAKLANAITDQGEGGLVAPDKQNSASNQNADADQNQAPRVLAAAIQAGLFKYADADEVLPEFQPKPGTRFAAFGNLSHYKRFVDTQATLDSQDWEKVIGGAVFYPDGKPSADLPAWAAKIDRKTIQDSLNTIWTYLIECIQTGFQTGNLSSGSTNPKVPSFNDAMLSFKYIIPLSWQWGECPSYKHRSERVKPSEVQKAMDAVDPLCLFHWDAATAKLRAEPDFQKNACQGLNQCKGMGWGGIATAKGNGACATADLHTCGANNSCKHEGGCGFLVSKGGEACGTLSTPAPTQANAASGSASTTNATGGAVTTNAKGGGIAPELLPPSEEWIPGQNTCGKWGGCETPISPEQVFNNSARATIEAQTAPEWTDEVKAEFIKLLGTNVWDRARALFAGTGTLPEPISKKVGKIDYDGTARRAAIQPTSK